MIYSDSLIEVSFLFSINSLTTIAMKELKHLVNKTEKEIALPFELCIRCGKKDNLSLHDFYHTQTDPLAKAVGTLDKFGIGILGFDLVVNRLLNKRYKVKAFFCRQCGWKLQCVKKGLRYFGPALIALAFFAILAAILGIQSGDALLAFAIMAFGGIVAFAAAITVGGSNDWNDWLPKIESVDDRKVILNIPGQPQIVHFYRKDNTKY